MTLKGLMLHCVQWSGHGCCVATDNIPALQDSVCRALVIACNPMQPGSPGEKIIPWTNNLWFSTLLQASFAALTI